VLITMFANYEQMTAVSTGTVPGYKAEPGGPTGTLLELLSISHSGHQGRGGVGGLPFSLGDPLTELALLKPLSDSPVKDRNSDINHSSEFIEIGESLSEE
jgi:hypothetical protein